MGYNSLIVISCCLLLGGTAGLIGSFSLLRKQALIGDAIAHALLPGICLGYLVSFEKNPLFIVLGAFFTGWLSTVLVDYLSSKSKLKEDTVIAIVLSVFFAIGIVMLTFIQQVGGGNQSGLDAFLFGQAAAMSTNDVVVFGLISIVSLGIVILFYPWLKYTIFDQAFCQSIGLPTRMINILISTLTVIAVVAGIQAVGVVLMAALLIVPAAAARYWTKRLRLMLIFAAVFGALSGIGGAFISYAFSGMPTGPWIVIFLFLIALISMVFSPSNGVVKRLLKQYRINKTFAEENTLKLFYQLDEKTEIPPQWHSYDELKYQKSFVNHAILNRLTKNKLLLAENKQWKLSELGWKKAERLVKIHRLWELYLTDIVKIAPDHVHEDAETIEHILTPELEKRLEERLKYPLLDPHKSPIPYGKSE
jgi:manganese/zinc/iron transport system permease protein